MKKTISFFAVLFFTAISLGCFAQSNVEVGYVKNELRAPAYPLINIDTYTSGWSMTDNLYDSSVKHWTGKDFPLDKMKLQFAQSLNLCLILIKF